MHKPQALSAHVRALKTMNKTLQNSSVIESNESVEAIILSILALCLRQVNFRRIIVVEFATNIFPGISALVILSL